MNEKDQKQALFWCQLLYPIIFEEVEPGEISHHMESLSQKEVVFPCGKYKKPGLSTLWGKLKIYRESGFEALARKPRKDRGKIRAIDQEIIEKAIELKKEQPERSDIIINIFLEHYYGKILAKSTLYRHLREAGATRKKLGISKKKVRCRWSREHTHSLWVGDFEDGPYVMIDGQTHRTYLSAFIDCHSRFIVEARYYLRSNKAVLEDTLLRAWSIHGGSRELYVDNAKVYRCNSLLSACLSLNIKLLHRPVREPESGGKIEKFFQTVQSQFESEVYAGTILDLDSLNRSFSAWLAVCYHRTVNSETKETPEEKYQKGLVVIRRVDINKVIKYFYERENRTVHKDFADVSIKGKFYIVDKKLCSDRVTVYYDIFSKMETVLIYSLKGLYLGKGQLHTRQKQEQISLSTTSEKQKPKHDLLAILLDKHKKDLNTKIQGIDYRKAVIENNWSFLAFVQSFAELLGRKGGTSAFSTEEYQSLDKIYKLHPTLNESILLQAFEMAEFKTIVHITFELQRLDRKE